MAWEWKKTKLKSSGASTQHLEHQLVPSQYKRSGPIVKGFRGCGLVEGGKKPIFGFQPGPLLGKCFAGMAFFPKEVVDRWDRSMRAREVGNEKPQALSIQTKRKGS